MEEGCSEGCWGNTVGGGGGTKKRGGGGGEDIREEVEVEVEIEEVCMGNEFKSYWCAVLPT